MASNDAGPHGDAEMALPSDKRHGDGDWDVASKPPKDNEQWEGDDHHDSRKRDDDNHRASSRRTARRSRSRSRSRSPAARGSSRRSRSRSRSPRERRRSRSPSRRDTERERVDRHRDRSRSRDRGDRSNYKERDDEGGASNSRSDPRAAPRGSYSGRGRADDPMRRQVNREVAAQEASKRSIKENRVYVGNLAFSVKWSDLKDFMREVGNVVFAEVMLLPNGMSKGCGVVEFSTREEAEKAIRDINDTTLFGRPVFVREDREDEARYGSLAVSAHGAGGRGGYSGSTGFSSRGGYGGAGSAFAAAGAGHAAQQACKQLAVSGLPLNVGWQDLKDMFRSAGNIVRADVHYSPDGSPTGNGMVAFESARDAQNAIAMFNGFEYEGRTMEVREDRSAPSQPSGGFRGGFRGGFGGRGGFGRGGYAGRGGFSGAGHDGASGGRDTSNLYGDYSGQEGSQNGGAGTGGGGGFSSGGYSGGRGGGGGRGGFGGGFGGRGGFGGMNIPASQQIFVKNMPWSTSNEDLVELFQTTGKVNHAEVLHEGGRSKGVGVIEFETVEEAEGAIGKFQNYSYGGRPLSLEFNARWRDFGAGAGVASGNYNEPKMEE